MHTCFTSVAHHCQVADAISHRTHECSTGLTYPPHEKYQVQPMKHVGIGHLGCASFAMDQPQQHSPFFCHSSESAVMALQNSFQVMVYLHPAVKAHQQTGSKNQFPNASQVMAGRCSSSMSR